MNTTPDRTHVDHGTSSDDEDDLEDILREVALTRADLQSRVRTPDLIAKRREVFLRLRKIGLSYPEIGRLAGGRHHTTVLSVVRGPVA